MDQPMKGAETTLSRARHTLRVMAFFAAAAIGILAFWGGMTAAALHYPTEYDWRYMTITSLLSAGRDPGGYLWASAGIVLSGLCGLFWASLLGERSSLVTGRVRNGGARALKFGYLCMVCAAVPSPWLHQVRKGHEIVVLLAFGGVCLGTVLMMYGTIEQRLSRPMGRPTGRPRLYAAILAGSAVLPILLAGLAQAYVYYVLPELRWVNLSWREHDIKAYLSFAFWEWITCAVLSAYVVILSLAMTRSDPGRRTDA